MMTISRKAKTLLKNLPQCKFVTINLEYSNLGSNMVPRVGKPVINCRTVEIFHNILNRM
jgi:hypothetical protein